MAASQRNSARAADTTWTLAEAMVKRGDEWVEGLALTYRRERRK